MTVFQEWEFKTLNLEPHPVTFRRFHALTPDPDGFIIPSAR